MDQRLRVIVTGLIAQHRAMGGVAWDYLNVVLGMESLGHEVYYFEDSGQWPYTLNGGPGGNEWIAYDCGENVRYLNEVLSCYGFGDRWAYRSPLQPQWFGLSDARRRDVVRTADLLLNVSGTLEYPQDYRSVKRLVYLDTDPIFTQAQILRSRADLGDVAGRLLRQRVDQHDVHFSVGECLGLSDLQTGHEWRPTKHPIALDAWRTTEPPRSTFTTIMNWTSYPPLSLNGSRYGQKDMEFKRFLGLPQRLDEMCFEVALSRTRQVRWETTDDPLPEALAALVAREPSVTPQELLTSAGWRVVDAIDTCGDHRSYRSYVQSSMAEWSVAKHGYVAGRSGWFSGRSACFLAAGRPVVVQDTGFSAVVPTGSGVLPFTTLEEAVDACRRVAADYESHARGAVDVAAECFDARKVLAHIIEQT